MTQLHRTLSICALLASPALAQQTLFTFFGDAAGDKYGYSVRSAGDIDADGIPDMIVGAAFDQSNGNRSGSVRIYSGKDGAVLFAQAGAALDEFGYAVDAAGDVDADGHADYIVGVNTFLGTDGSPIQQAKDVMRSSDAEKRAQIDCLRAFQAAHADAARRALAELKDTALAGGNVFGSLMQAAKVCSLGQISGALYEIGGQYRRNM